MKARTLIPFVAVLFAAFTLNSQSHAQSPLVNIDTVTVGDPGNAADTTGYGAVADVFAIGKYEVTIGQYTTFLNSVASVTSEGYIRNLWNANMTSNLNIAGISRSGDGSLASPYSYSVIGSGNRPIAYVSWFDAARFANWMNNGATNGASTETGAYTLNGAMSGIITVNPGARWFLPSEDQWYKAAYFSPNYVSPYDSLNLGGPVVLGGPGYYAYATQSDTAPGNIVGGATNQANYYAGDYAVTQSATYSSSQNYLTDAGVFSNSASAYETFDQGGNLYEWNDAVIGEFRGVRGGSWDDLGDANQQSSSRNDVSATTENYNLGFRVATVPEPSTYALMLMTGAGALWLARRKRD
jgi:sulfatase modifying factor 1